MAQLAEITAHLTPAGFARERQKLALPVPFFAVHLRARFREQVARELLAYKLPGVEITRFDTTYEF